MDEIEVNELIVKAQGGDDDAMEQILRQYMPKVSAIAREYFLIGGGYDDLIQEGIIGLYKAIKVYDETKNKNFSAFASLCIHRQLQNAVKLANRKKNSPLNEYLPIKYFDGSMDEKSSLVIVDDESNVEKMFMDKEFNDDIMTKIKNVLTEEQFAILSKFLQGVSYVAIGEEFNMTTKQVDNSLQAIKKKIKAIKGDIS
ncbi:MAG: sigma-70 family RNA polymerase sigma factor [Clostridiales bacterium]|nr:sigma-70 family RNA polymerase sigma factor [Clostridiales bacterium]